MKASRERHRARMAAVQGLYQWQLTGNTPRQVEEHILTTPAADGADLEYLHDLLTGVPEHLGALDEAVSPHMDRSLQSVDPVERAILRLGAWELIHRPEVPWRVVISEAVELAHQFGAEQGHRYVNAVLDRAARELRRTEIEATGGGAA
ncbi:NusB antitermination factor [Thiohalospira halophila DSM 15071]|uniref:Transcription antitermination protein NusB n=1 Tax=Thiohalospira halophila DSM 15071 TaxID=1123397 RepID=A0A1I1UBT8_9GAMM|nr:transcription antitermination factor NusB [Thiohalospira halophila]SFD65410.1 NusB antitermination factor [Thiohalospira halophila DSM 15071]